MIVGIGVSETVNTQIGGLIITAKTITTKKLGNVTVFYFFLISNNNKTKSFSVNL